MKKLSYVTLGFCLLFASAHLKVNANNYQQRIDTAFHQFIKFTSMEEIDRIVQELENVPSKSRLHVYWGAYAKYKQALAYSELHKEEKSCKKTCAKILSSALKQLETNSHKSSEDYALMSVIKNLSISFSPALKIPFLSNSAKSDAQSAIAADPENIRAYIAAGVQDYYTPEMYGGGKQYEDYFLKALKLPDKKTQNPYEPSWGREEAYIYLVIHYYRQGDKEKAKQLLKEGISICPKEPRLHHLSTQM